MPELASANAEKRLSVGESDELVIPNRASVAWSCMAWSEISTMSLAGAFSSAVWMAGEERVESSGEFSLVSVWSRSVRPLLLEPVLPDEEALAAAIDPISAFPDKIGAQAESFNTLTNHY